MTEDGMAYYLRPQIVVCANMRHQIGLALSAQTDVEVCWSFPLSQDKLRMLCNVVKSETEAAESIWKTLTDDVKMSYRSAVPGQKKKDTTADELNQYEAQVEDKIPSNFLVVELTPLKVDHTVYAPPAVVADQRRKPQQYESLA